MTDEKIARINALYRKSKAEGLTDAEIEERAVLRQGVCRRCERQSTHAVE